MMEHVRRGARLSRHGTIPPVVTSHSSASHDDAFHEIQLNGKQLFFLFMAATVVSVVIFLCGVLVGRGVRAERTAADLETVNTSPSADAVPPGVPPTAAGADPTIVPPPPPSDEIAEVSPSTPAAGPAAKKSSEGKGQTAAEPPKASKSEPAAPKSAAAAPKPAPPATGTSGTSATAGTAGAAASAAGAPPDAKARDWFVQVMATPVKNDADSSSKKLAAKGYQAYVVPPTDGTAFFRVRVGSFKNKSEAQVLADKLQKDLGIKPYVNR
jgi:cell division septation protein DedD